LKPISQHHEPRFALARWFNRTFDSSTNKYVSSIAYLLKRPMRVMLVFALIIGGVAYFFNRLPSSFIPQEDQGVLLTIIQTPTGSAVENTDAVLKKVEN